jgi:hypothetical protein
MKIYNIHTQSKLRVDTRRGACNFIKTFIAKYIIIVDVILLFTFRNPTRITDADEIQFQRRELLDEEESTHQLEKYALSNALSLSG